MSELRLPPLARLLHATAPRQQDHPRADLPALWPQGSDDGARGVRFHRWNISGAISAFDFYRWGPSGKCRDMADLSDNIEAAAQAPVKVTTDGITVEARDISEQIEADAYVAGKSATRGRHRGLVISKLSPPGAS